MEARELSRGRLKRCRWEPGNWASLSIRLSDAELQTSDLAVQQIFAQRS